MRSGKRAVLSSLLLVALAGAAVAAAWFGIARQDDARQARRSAEERLFTFQPADVTGVTVEAKGETTRLVRDGDRWRLDAPVHAAADRAIVDTMVDRLAELRRKGVADGAAPDAAQRYGLARPRATVTVALRDGKTETLALGDENPFDGTIFARSTGAGVTLIPGDVRWTIERSAFDLREKRLVPFEDGEVVRVEVTTPARSYVLAREGPDAWRLEAPVHERADPAAAARALSAVRALRASAFRTASPKEPPPGGPRWTVALSFRNRPPSRVVVWPYPTPGAAAARGDGERAPTPLLARVEGSGEVATVPESAARDLEQDVATLRGAPSDPPAKGPTASPGLSPKGEREAGRKSAGKSPPAAGASK